MTARCDGLPQPGQHVDALRQVEQQQPGGDEVVRRAGDRVARGEILSVEGAGWILWMEAWARAPHNRQVTQFMEELLAPWRDDLAAIIARGVAEGTFAAPASLDDFTLRFNALLDGLALLRLRQLHQPSRKYLVELALTTARAELSPDDPAATAD